MDFENKDYYKLLGFENLTLEEKKNLSVREIERAFYEKMFESLSSNIWDNNDIKEAHEFLINDENKAEYDKYLETKKIEDSQDLKLENNEFNNALFNFLGKNDNFDGIKSQEKTFEEILKEKDILLDDNVLKVDLGETIESVASKLIFCKNNGINAICNFNGVHLESFNFVSEEDIINFFDNKYCQEKAKLNDNNIEEKVIEIDTEENINEENDSVKQKFEFLQEDNFIEMPKTNFRFLEADDNYSGTEISGDDNFLNIKESESISKINDTKAMDILGVSTTDKKEKEEYNKILNKEINEVLSSSHDNYSLEIRKIKYQNQIKLIEKILEMRKNTLSTSKEISKIKLEISYLEVQLETAKKNLEKVEEKLKNQTKKQSLTKTYEKLKTASEKLESEKYNNKNNGFYVKGLELKVEFLNKRLLKKQERFKTSREISNKISNTFTTIYNKAKYVGTNVVQLFDNGEDDNNKKL